METMLSGHFSHPYNVRCHLMARRPHMHWHQIARGVFFVAAHSVLLGVLIGAVIVAVKAIVAPALTAYIGMAAVFGVVFAYGMWVWAPLWVSQVRKQWK